MPSKEPDARRRRKDYDRDRQSPRSKDKDRNQSSRAERRTLSREVERDEAREKDRKISWRRSSLSSSHSSVTKAKHKTTMLNPDSLRRSSSGPQLDSRSGMPYPTFSKAHSREAVGSREEVVKPSVFPLTPETTDLSQSHASKSVSPRAPPVQRRTSAAPPSPPLTAALDGGARGANSRSGSAYSPRKTKDQVSKDWHDNDRGSACSPGPRFSASRSSLRHAEEGSSTKIEGNHASPVFRTKSTGHFKESVSLPERTSSSSLNNIARTHKTTPSNPSSSTSRPGTDSDATSIAPDRKRTPHPPALSHSGSSPPSDNDSSPPTPVAQEGGFASLHGQSRATEDTQASAKVQERPDFDASQPPSAAIIGPPPPPPPAVVPVEVPKVDYLLQNGGLPYPVPKAFASATSPTAAQSYQQYSSPSLQTSRTADVQSVFHPYQKLLDGFSHVLSKNGSIAVATGYRSVARRLLERLEAVFARNISKEICRCVMCRSNPLAPSTAEEDTGVSWGEILEFVSGRRELPPWPPFSLATSESGLGISDLDREPPMQKLDIDVLEEHREHYIRQSKKVKQSVQNWLASQPEENASPPHDVDDETLTFAMLTYLEPSQRPVFAALMKGFSALPTSRTPTPLETEPRSELMARVGLALQRLYRLPRPPREPESSMYLLKNPSLHNVLATLAAISNHEWDILISGRFDGFLWSGAEEHEQFGSLNGRVQSSRGPTPSALLNRAFSPAGGVPLSRGTTPLSAMANNQMPLPFRGTTPFSSVSTTTPGGPIHLDEETEIAVLAEVEREIYLGMEALEDAFEALHSKAESVRLALRERSAGLAVRAMERRGSGAEGIEVRLGTPATGMSNFDRQGGIGSQNSFRHGDADAESLWGGMDERSELAPDDSASNVGWKEHGKHRKRRPGRRTERRTETPRLIEEDE